MTGPGPDQPAAPDEPWVGPQPVPVQAQQPAQPPPYLPTQAYWPPNPPVTKQNNGLAIVAIVIASLALLIVLTSFVLQAFFGVLLGGLLGSSGSSSADSGLKGTAPQVVAGKAYPGAMLADEVSRVARDDGGDVGSVTCPDTQEVKSGAVSVCQGDMDGSSWDFQVTFDDASGHFTLDERDTGD